MLGWVGSIMLALCGLPQALQCIREGHARGLNLLFLSLWTSGEILTLIAIVNDANGLWYLLGNYGTNLLFLSIIWYFKLKSKIESVSTDKFNKR